jgi:Gamma-glutamyl cyclotransferase, AIG2-like
MTENLFSYGTLQSTSVQLKTFGRTLEGYPDDLIGYKISLVKIQDETLIASIGMTHHQNISFTGNPSDAISGTVFLVSEEELKQADVYEEPADYTRMQVNLKSGKKAWVYAWANTQIK